MNSLQIDALLRRHPATRRIYLGCYASDRIPHAMHSYPHCMIVNTDAARYPGEHWTAIYVSAPGRAEYYDSLGEWPPVANIARYLARFAHVHFSRHAFQSERSSSCGYHSMYFLIARCSPPHIHNTDGGAFRAILRHLRECRSAPDRVVAAYVRRYLHQSDATTTSAAVLL